MNSNTRLAVILHADIVGSTTLVQRDERVAHDRMQAAFRRLSGTISAYGGTTRELRGDALVAEFAKASSAVAAALAFQSVGEGDSSSSPDEIRPRLRIGIALGEVVFADHTVTGAGVVLAQRLEQLAEPRGLCISAAVREALPSRLPFRYTSLGERPVKGFDDPVHTYRVSCVEGTPVPSPEGSGAINRNGIGRAARLAWVGGSIAMLIVAGGVISHWGQIWAPGGPASSTAPLPDRPSIAVLPFRNDSDDAGQTFFANGVTEDIITDLSKVSGLFVVSREATFQYGDSNPGPKQVAKALGVRYVLEGSVRRSGNSIRVTAQLVDALQGNHLWAERYDRNLQDVFAVQSEVAARVAKALAVTLKTGEHERLFQKYATSIESYDVFIQARRTVDVPSQANIRRGEVLFKRVIELDPAFAGGYAGLSFNHSVKARFGYGESREEEVRASLELAKKAISIDPQLGWSYVALGGAQLAAGDAKAAVDTMRQALILLPGDYEVHLFTGLFLQFAGEPAEAIEHLELAKRMNPVDTDRNLAFLGMAYFMSKDYQQAEEYWERRLRKFPAGTPMGPIFLSATYALQGKTEEAANVADQLKEAFPSFRLGEWGWALSYRKPENRERLHRGARLAGVPQ